MAPSTKLALAGSLKKLLQKKFLDDITVKELVEDCQVNRQTFYYHFQDIYDLLHWFLERETEEALRDAADWREALSLAFRYIQDNHVVIYHVYRSSARESRHASPDESMKPTLRQFTITRLTPCSTRVSICSRSVATVEMSMSRAGEITAMSFHSFIRSWFPGGRGSNHTAPRCPG